MKYVFSSPQLLEVNTEKRLIVSHRIFLTPEQRKILQVPSTIVETVAVNSPVWIVRAETNEPACEVFCRYRVLAGDPLEYPITANEFGYDIYLGAEKCKRLDDLKNGGCCWVTFTSSQTVCENESIYPAIHQVVISDIGELERSMFAVHFPQISSK